MHWTLQCTWMTCKVSPLSLIYILVPTMLKDHIFTLQYSLAHYERILSELSPIYLSQLRTDLAVTKSGEDKALLYLTSITVAGLCIQSCIGSCLVSKFAIPVLTVYRCIFCQCSYSSQRSSSQRLIPCIRGRHVNHYHYSNCLHCCRLPVVWKGKKAS